MKPIKLKLRGFITYKNEIEIDFTNLYSKKIFVISGDTGSGKTSIFDAISFALYGDVARPIPLDRLRCDFLSDDDLYTYVNLTFEVDNRFYEIERIPRQIAKKTKVAQNIAPSVILYDISDEKKIIAEKINEAKDKINEIIGLDQNQFNKVMLLAQGEFQQFLNSKSDDRTKLLGDIFKTYEYKNIEEKIKEKAKASRKELEFIDNDLNYVIERYIDIKSIVNKDDILVYEFSNIIDDITKEKIKLNDYLNELTDKEIDKQKEQEKEISYRQSVKSRNENIDKYKNIEAKYNEEILKKDHYEKRKSDYEKSIYAKNIKIYEDRFKDVRDNLALNKDLLNNNLTAKKDIEIALEKLLKEREEIPKKEKLSDEYKYKLNLNIKKLDDFRKFLNIKKEYQKIVEELEKSETLKKELDYEIENLYKNREKLEELRNIIELKRDDNLTLSNKIIEDKNNLDKINNDIKKSIKNYNILKKIEINSNLFDDLNIKKIELIAKKEEEKENQRLVSINNLIDELNETEICPVCGDHHEIKYSKKDILEIIDIDIDDKILEINTKIATITTENKVLKDSIEEILDEENLDNNKRSIEEILNKSLNLKKINTKDIENLSKNIEDIIYQNENLNKKINDKKIILNKLEQKSTLVDDLKIKYLSQKDVMEDINEDNLNIQIIDIKKTIASIDEEIKSFNDKLNFLNKKEIKINSEIENTKAIIKKEELMKENYSKEFMEKIDEKFINRDEYRDYLDIYDDIINYKDEISTYFDELNKLSIMLSNLSEFKNIEKVNLEDIELNILKISDELKEISSQKSNLKIKVSNIDETIKKIEEIRQRYEMIKGESEILSKLSKIADGSFGKVAGREKIDFETFVLTYYFDKVLHFSNMRLLNMSNGQFSMIRRSIGSDGRVKSGLDIEILDSNTGKKRPASTLSGGESFLASLSLALGLSDEISAENGGIKIDTLFIDEGFGTLSEEYLNNVIEQIEKLSYEDKFIGLISHVEELKDAIDAKILVNYTNSEGSFIEVIS